MKRFVIGSCIALGLLIAVAVASFFGIGYYLSPQDPLAKVDAIVAISGGDTDARISEAVALYRDGWASHLIFSGAALDPNGPSNARAMAAIAKRAGVPETAIELDEAAANTRQNATGSAAIIAAQHYRSIILVTSPYHQRRASLVFHRVLGDTITIINHSSVDQDWRRAHWWATAYSRQLTASEIQKVIFELASGQP